MNLQSNKPRGIVLIIILACMAVASVLLIIGVKLAVIGHRVTQTVSCMAQAELLVDSGMERAAAQLAADATYTGETWKISAADLGTKESGLVKIEVKTVAERANQRLVKIQADFPDDPLDRVRYSKELTLELQ